MSGFFDSPGPRVFGFRAGVDFAAGLAEGIRARLGAAPPEALAQVEVTVNTRRTLRAVQDAFEAEGPAVFLPKLSTMDSFASGRTDLPPAVDRLSRWLALTRLTSLMLKQRPELGPPGAAGPLAEALAELMNEFQREGLPLSALDEAAEVDPAAHWRRTLEFLLLIREHWPDHLAAEPVMSDAEARRFAEVEALIADWASNPPAHPIIAAGSTGSTKGRADLLVAIANAPQGAIVLSGFDFALDAEGWEGVTPDHPQYGHAKLLERLEITPAGVRLWTGGEKITPRTRLLTEALRPAPVTHRWREALPVLRAEAEAATSGLELIEAASPAREADAIALVMREALERPEGRVALVTADGNLVRRVTASLRRWGLVPDDSGGMPLALTPPGVFITMVADMLCRPFDQVALLALLKHPLMAAGEERRVPHLRGVSRLERKGLRRRDIALRLDSVSAIEEAMVGRPEEREPLADEALRAALLHLRPWPGKRPLGEMIAAHRAAAEALAGVALYEKEAGQMLHAALERFALAAESSGYGEAAPVDYPALFAEALNDGGEVREEPWASHPRLKMWGQLEARSQTAETVIVGGLVEGSWPATPAVDPWLSRPMRARVGLPPPERRVGLSAHDFAQCAAAPRVVLSYSTKADGAPTAPARWLSRLTALLSAVEGGAPLKAMRERGARWTGLAERLGLPEFEIPRAPRPEPRPPASARPRTLSVTAIERLIRDPYSIYADHVLDLGSLDEPGAPADQRDRGDALHEVVEQFILETKSRWPGAGPAAVLFDRIAEEVIEASVAGPLQSLAWRARLMRVRDWFIAGEEKRREEGRPLALEASGELDFNTSGGPFRLRGRADRVDLQADKSLAIYDYKAGSMPSKEQARIFQKQLPLLALIALNEGLENVPAAKASILRYLSLSGSGEGGAEREVETEDDTMQRLVSLIEDFEDENRPYLPRAYPEMMSFTSDYDHLSRYGEWEDRIPEGPPPGAPEAKS